MPQLVLSSPTSPTAPVYGISEWMNYYQGNELECCDPVIIDQCVDVHRDMLIDGLAWNAGRATILYQSDLAHTTRQCELGMIPKPQRVSGDYMLRILDQICPLGRAIELGSKHDMPIMGRLSMNRYYGGGKNIDSTSRFFLQHPNFVDIGKLGQPIPTRLCYAIEEVQQERLDILLEIQRKGVDALLLDFCRQVPIIGYHPDVVRPFQQRTGCDPRTIDSTDPADYETWFQYRADILTGFMRRLRRAVRQQEGELGRPCPIVVRVPDYARWLLLGCSLDLEAWCAHDLIDGTMLSPFPRFRDDWQSYPEYHVTLTHRHGKFCIGGVGSNRLKARQGRDAIPSEWRHACQVAHRQYAAGVDAMSLYQSEDLCRSPYLYAFIRRLGDKEWIASQADSLPYPEPEDDAYVTGRDWHSHRVDEGLSTQHCGNLAL